MKFNKGQKLVWLHDGQEYPAVVLASGPTEDGSEIYHIDLNGEKRHVNVSELLLPKKPGFEIRDLVLVLDENKDAIKGEIAQIGDGPKGHKFYQVKFDPETSRAASWYSEDEVFIVSKPKKHSTPKVSTL